MKTPPVVALALAWVGLTLACNHVVCPSAQWCEGDAIVTCRLECAGGGSKFDPPTSCERRIERFDCAQYGVDTFGVSKTCVAFNDASSRFFVCVDQPLVACGLGANGGIDTMRADPVSCTAAGAVLACQGTNQQAFFNTQPCGGPGHACVPLASGLTCVDAPKAPCDPSAYPRCEGAAVKSCRGSADAGFFIATDECGTTPGPFTIHCAERDGGASCVWVPLDGGVDGGP